MLQQKNFDHPDAFDWDLLFQQVNDLRNGKSIEQPTYSFLKCDRLPETVRVEPTNVIIVEGIMALYRKELRDLMDLKIFVDADPDERLIRVIERDVIERGKTAREVMSKYRRVLKPMHRQFIEGICRPHHSARWKQYQGNKHHEGIYQKENARGRIVHELVR